MTPVFSGFLFVGDTFQTTSIIKWVRLMEDMTRVRFTNLDKTMYPELRLSKKDVVEYYIRVAPRILPFLRDRALVRTRYPDGMQVDGFYEKDAPSGTPDWVRRFVKYSKSVEKDTHYVVCDDLDTLLWLANLASLELHMPLSRVTDTSKPDFVLFDLDPEPPAGIGEAVEAAMIIREALDERGVKPYVKTSGRKGVHVLIHVKPIYSFMQTSGYVHEMAKELAARHGFIVSERRQTNVPGTVLIDYPQNSERSTVVAPYSLRAVREATVSTPVTWDALPSVRPFDLNIYNVPGLTEDPWRDIWDEPQEIT
jgi:bifunctional non-homologous end joining protein LigD